MFGLNKTNKGFTIIELIVVIAIIAILAAVVMVNVTQYINKSKVSAMQANMRTMQINAGIYLADPEKGNGSYSNFDVSANSLYKTPKDALENMGWGGSTMSLFLAESYCFTKGIPNSDPSPYWCIDSSGFNGYADACDSNGGAEAAKCRISQN